MKKQFLKIACFFPVIARELATMAIHTVSKTRILDCFAALAMTNSFVNIFLSVFSPSRSIAYNFGSKKTLSASKCDSPFVEFNFNIIFSF